MFEINQKVVCVRTHSQGVVKEGEVYTVKDIDVNHCCKSIVLDVGFVRNGSALMCRCGSLIQNRGNAYWIGSRLFRPLDDMYNEEIEELTEVLSEPVTFS